MQRDSKDVMAELVAKLSERLEPKPAQENATVGKPRGVPAPNRDRLMVGVDLGDQWSNYCILGLEGETLAEGDTQGKAGAGKVPPTLRMLRVSTPRWHASVQRLPPMGTPPVCRPRIVRLDVRDREKKIKDGRHVGLDFYDLLIEEAA